MAIAFGYEVCCVVSCNSVLHYAMLCCVTLVSCMTTVNWVSTGTMNNSSVSGDLVSSL